MVEFERPLLPAVTKRAFPLGLACNFGIDSDGVRSAVAAGVNYIFWTTMGTSRAAPGVREALNANREGIILSAGTGGPFGFHYRSRVEAILKKFDIDYIDIFQLFWLGVTAWDTRGVMDALMQLREEGKIRAIGVTIHDRKRAGRLTADSDLDMLQVRYNAAHPGAETDIFPHLVPDRRFITAYTATSWRKLLKAPKGWDGAAMTAGDCYRFCLTNPAISVVLTGPKNSEELQENLDALRQGPLSAEQLAWMRSFGEAVHG